jgi:hypothetical protein
LQNEQQLAIDALLMISNAVKTDRLAGEAE